MSSASVGNIAEASSNLNVVPGRSQTMCRYYLRGICRFGDSLCRFSHDITRGRHEGEPHASNINPNTDTDADVDGDIDAKAEADRRNWVNAPIFVPSQKRFEIEDAHEDEATGSSIIQNGVTWAEIVGVPSTHSQDIEIKQGEPHSLDEVCPYESPCPYGKYCPYRIHMELCEMCDQYCLHPTDQAQRKKHNRECLQQHEQAMELSFAIAQSKDKTCGICFDTIMEKAGREKRFGILPNCNHIFCLECIRTWRQAKQFEHKITRACPECRVCSDFVCPSAFWVETKEEKDKLLNDYRAALGAKDCKYFKKGEGKCPFGNKCFYKHALPNGDIVDVGLPKRARKAYNQSQLMDLLDIYLWEYVDRRDIHWLEYYSSDLSDGSDFTDEE
ncbi:GH14787 [Drosophila grimshawi]|uniref:RING-type E3 ubiquitin transferase n=1 Tax=Drosophila grimshawi TaxID=7222 RepID=B4J3E8_DROGR|nr:GH14787 [Drosophila grimshawi]